jgi:RNA recognition motif-containing protein
MLRGGRYSSRGRGRGGLGGSRGHGGGNPCMVYVANLSYDSSWQDLKDHMRKAGEVVYADIFRTEAGHSKGSGVVEYATEAEAQHAISTLNESTLEGTDRPIFVREDRIEYPEPSARGRGRGRGFFPPPRGGGHMIPSAVIYPPPHPYHGGRFRGRGAPSPIITRGGGVLVQGEGFVAPPGSIVFPPHAAAALIIPPAVHPQPYGKAQSRGRGRGQGPVVEGSRAGRQIFVGNLPYHTSWQDLKDLFAEFGLPFD